MTAPLDIQSSTPTICAEHGNLIQRFHYGYDALGRRITKQDAFGTTLYLWDGDQMVLKRRGGNETHTLYLPHSFVPLAQIHNGQVHHLHTDHLGTPLEASTDQGQITWRVTYKTWGNVLVQEEEQITQNLRFQGQYFDQETGHHYNRFRYYDPGPGPFVSQDPIGLAGGVNFFQYAPNSTGWVDPFGLIKFTKSKKDKILEENRTYHGMHACEKCLCELTKPEKSQRGITPPKTDWQIDHIEAEINGGTASIENGQALCRTCNREKSYGPTVNYKQQNRDQGGKRCN